MANVLPLKIASGAVQQLQSADTITAAIISGLASWNDFRLSGTSATPVMTADSTSLSTIYLCSYKGNSIALYDGTNWILYTPGSEVSLAVTGRTTDLPFDVFAYYSGSAVTLEFLDWTNATTRATNLVRQDGVWCKTGALTRRYLGTVRARSATTFHWVRAGSDAPAKFDLWNANNRVPVNFSVILTADSWNWTTASFQQANGSANAQVDVCVGLQEDCFHGQVLATRSNTSSVNTTVAIGYDSTTTASGIRTAANVATNFICMQGSLSHQPAIGRHFYAWLEHSTATGTTSWKGDNGASILQSGMTGVWFC